MMVAHYTENDALDRALLTGSAVLMGLLAMVFVNWGFIA
jgi:hypothetical protein